MLICFGPSWARVERRRKYVIYDYHLRGRHVLDETFFSTLEADDAGESSHRAEYYTMPKSGADVVYMTISPTLPAARRHFYFLMPPRPPFSFYLLYNAQPLGSLKIPLLTTATLLIYASRLSKYCLLCWTNTRTLYLIHRHELYGRRAITMVW